MSDTTVKTVFELSEPGRPGYAAPEIEVEATELPLELRRSEEADLPELSENEVVRHYTRLSDKNYHIDRGFYPLGSCTMKYNPKVNDALASLPGFSELHPHQAPTQVQGALRLMVELEEALGEITGMAAVSLQPAAGAHGELLGMMLARQDHRANGGGQRKRVLIPDSAHGTNPASAALMGFGTDSVKTGPDGRLDIEDLKTKLGPDVVGLMLTNPNTLGIFESGIEEIAELIHGCGGLMYMDGANMNAILGQTRPGDMGFDMVHLNLHKTFSTPHGGGGPGCGPLCVVDRLEPYLPYPRPVREGEGYAWREAPLDGTVHQRIHGTFGNFGMMVRALAYILRNGGDGLARVGEMAVLNANYLKVLLKDAYPIDHAEGTLHEFVASGREFKAHGVRTLDIAKRLLDLGYHAPTIYFPLVVDEALMIEPTETETKQTLEAFAATMLQIKREAEEDPEILKRAPTTTPVKRLDETKANRQPMVCWGGHC